MSRAECGDTAVLISDKLRAGPCEAPPVGEKHRKGDDSLAQGHTAAQGQARRSAMQTLLMASPRLSPVRELCWAWGLLWLYDRRQL